MSVRDVAVVVPVWAGANDLARIVREVRSALERRGVADEVVVAARPGAELDRSALERLGAAVVDAPGPGYGEILAAALARTTARCVVTVDADFPHAADYVGAMWEARDRADVLLASRYMAGGFADMPATRRALSRALNATYRKALSLPFRDLSSGFRLFHRGVLDEIGLPQARGLDALPEMVVRAVCAGWRVEEIPLRYRGAAAWSGSKTVWVGTRFLRSLGRLLALRNSVLAADYDHRAFDSWIPLQRYWHRRRFEIVREFVGDAGLVLDIGCGTSRIVQAFANVVATDLALRKLRWLRGAPGRKLVQADMNALPFEDATFDAVVCSEIIEHIPRERVRLDELVRVAKPGSVVVVGTPDYGRWWWRALEWIYGKVFPGGYASEHVNRYTNVELRSILQGMGLDVLECRYVGASEMIFRVRVPTPRRRPEVTLTP